MDSSTGQRLNQWVERLLSFPGIDPNYLVRMRTYWIMVIGAAVFVFFLTLLVWALGSRTLVWNGITLLLGYGLLAAYIALARRPILWIGIVGQIFTIVVTFGTIATLGGLFRSGGIITAAIAAVVFSMFLLRPGWTFFLFALFCVLLIATPFITPFLDFGADLMPFANTLLYIINTLWITGFMVFFVITFIRDRLSAEEAEARRLKELDSAKTQFYTNISHEFRTPLTIISGMAEQISEHPERWLGEGLDMIRHNSQRILSLVNQMLDLSKLDAGQMPVHMRQADVIPYLRYLADSFRSYAESCRLVMEFHTDTEEFIMDFDPGKLTDIVSNLFSNAIKFTPEGGRISMEISTQADTPQQLVVQVKDTGRGIPPEYIPHIFDRFFRGEHGEDVPGTGIGLSLTKELVQLLGGRIAVSSTPGMSTEFTVSLTVTRLAPKSGPFQPEDAGTALQGLLKASVQDSDEAAAHSATKPLILAVDDFPDILEFLKSVLAEQYRVVAASNGRDGVDKALMLTPDLIISDVMMPEMDGMELCRHLKQDPRSSHIPVILLTARADAASRLEGIENLADAYISKPFAPSELLLVIRNLLANRAAMRAHYMAAAAGLDGALETAESELPKAEVEFLQNVRNYIIDRIDDPDLHVNDLCRALFMSNSQLHRKLTALTGMAANRFIRNVRLHEAAILLRDPERSISDVAFDTGFRDPDYFGRAFRKYFGMTPSEYRMG